MERAGRSRSSLRAYSQPPRCRYFRQRERRVEPDPKHRPGGQLDVLPLGRGNRAAAADEDAGQRALRAAQDGADDRAGARADADLLLLAHDAFALERLRHRGADRVRAAVDRHAVERDRHRALAVGARGLVDRADDAAHRRSRRHEDAAALVTQVDHRRRLEAILDLRGLGAERVGQPDVELGADRDFVRVLRAADGTRAAAAAGADGDGVVDRRSSPIPTPGGVYPPVASPRARLRMLSMRSRTSA